MNFSTDIINELKNIRLDFEKSMFKAQPITPTNPINLTLEVVYWDQGASDRKMVAHFSEKQADSQRVELSQLKCFAERCTNTVIVSLI